MKHKKYLIIFFTSTFLYPLVVVSQNLIIPTASFLGTHPYERVGYHLHTAGDVNGDGYDDFLIGTFHNHTKGYNAGAAYLILGKKKGDWGYDVSLTLADARFLGGAAYDAAGYYLGGGGDINGDGYDDFLIGAPAGDDIIPENPGHIYVILGKQTPDWGYSCILPSKADISFDGENQHDLAGLSVAMIGDMNDDGYDDFICSSPFNDYGGVDAGKVYLILGKPNGWGRGMNLSQAGASFYSTTRYGTLGYSVDGAGDVNGDGIPDIAIGARGVGKVYLIFGRREVDWGFNYNINGADVIFYREQYDDWTGWRVSKAGDVNADGFDDLLIGTPMYNHNGDDVGKVYLILGRSTGWNTYLSEADASFIGEAPNDQAGWDVQDAGDVNGDGFSDFVIGAWYNDSNGPDAGKMYLIKGKRSGWQRNMSLSRIEDYFVGDHPGDYAGFSAARAGDVNGDGLSDVVTSSTYNNEARSWAGKILLFVSKDTTNYIPEISVDEDMFDFGSDLTALRFKITNSGTGVLNWNVILNTNQFWITLNPQSGHLISNDSQFVDITVDRTGLSSGSYSTTIQIIAPNASNNPVNIGVKLSVIPRIGCFRLFEVEMNCDNSYNNPYVDVLLSAHFSGPTGEKLDIDGYWQDRDIWKIRMMPTSPGRWTYTTTSNDPSLNGIIGQLECIESSHPGILIVNPDYPYTFKLSLGEPFFWLGETSWCLMSSAVPFFDSTFQKYIDIRREQEFNNIHFVLGTGGLPYGTTNPENEGGHLWVSQSNQRINPEFFKWVDKRISYLDSVQMAIGFFITWSQHFITFTREEFERFEKYLIARYAAYPMLYWVIVGEFDEAGSIDEYNYHGNMMNSRDPYGHLISIHPGGSDPNNLGTNRIFVSQQWLDFIMQQFPSFNMGNYTPLDINKHILVDRIYNMPVINAEFKYEDVSYNGKICTGDNIRKLAWAIVLGGGYPSYGHKETIRTVNINATTSVGALYMKYMYDYFKNLNWWEMNPDNNKVDNGFCLASSLPEYVVYLPEGGTVNIDFTNDTDLLQAQWYNPKEATVQNAPIAVCGQIQTYSSPFSNDAVLHFGRPTNPIISVEPESLYFSAVEGSNNPATQTITVTNIGGGTLLWTANEEPDQPWLNLNHSSGGSGEQLSVSIDISELKRGYYDCVIRISDPNALNNPVDIPVILTVRVPQPILSVSPTILDFDSVTCNLSFIITNSGVGILFWNVSENPDQSWLRLKDSLNGKLPAEQSQSLKVSIDRAGLTPAEYIGKIIITSNAGSEEVTVFVTVINPPILSISPTILNFDTLATKKAFKIANSGGSTLHWVADENPDEPWITLICPDSGDLKAGHQTTVVVRVDRNGLQEGDYTGKITISSNAGFENVIIDMIVSYPQILSVSPTQLDFDSTLTSMSFTIGNIGGSVLHWSVIENPKESWIISVDPDSGTLRSGQYDTIAVVIDRNGLKIGNYNAEIVINSDTGNLGISVTMSVRPNLFYEQRVNCGSDINYYASDGHIWMADKAYSAGNWGYIGGFIYSTPDSIANTNDDPLYQSERSRLEGYQFDVSNGKYDITLFFAEISLIKPGQRIFNVEIEGKQVLSNYDIFYKVGHDFAVSKTFSIIVSDNQLNINFINIIGNSKISAIKVIGNNPIMTVSNNIGEKYIPNSFTLYQNYPNPFNPTTTIAIGLPFCATLKLNIFNTLGQEVGVLQSGPLPAGVHRFVWNAVDEFEKSLPSGIYFYQVEVIENSQGNQKSIVITKKMLFKK